MMVSRLGGCWSDRPRPAAAARRARCVIAPNTVAHFYHRLEIENPKFHARLHYHKEPHNIMNQSGARPFSVAMSKFMFQVDRIGNLRIAASAHQIWPSPCSLHSHTASQIIKRLGSNIVPAAPTYPPSYVPIGNTRIFIMRYCAPRAQHSSVVAP